MCLEEGYFPDRWKDARLVLLLKWPDKPFSSPSSYKSVCLQGKVVKRLPLKRINDHIEADGRYSERQFGFCKNRSTLNALRIYWNSGIGEHRNTSE